MLNELYDLAESIRQTGITPKSDNDNYTSCPKGITYRILLDTAGRVVRIEQLKDIAEITSNKTYGVANGQSFPGFNIVPMGWASSESTRSALGDVLKHLKAGKLDAPAFVASVRGLMTQTVSLWDEKLRLRLATCLGKVPNHLASTIGNIPPDMISFAELLNRTGKIDVQQFANDLMIASLKLIESNPDTSKDVVRALLISTEKDLKAAKNKKSPVILELADRDKFAYPANHPKVQEWINSRLMAHAEVRISTQRNEHVDAYRHPAIGIIDSFPSVRLRVLGDVIIRSMNSESPCQYRYGKAESESFRVGQELRQRMKDALQWVGGASRQGKTWQDISGACGYGRANGKKKPIAGVLFAYPSILPSIPEEISEFAEFATLAAGDALQEARFESVAAGVAKAIQGIATEHPDVEVRIFALAKADRARTKLLARASPKASDYIRAAELWQEGTRNLPLIRLGLGSPDPVEPVTPFPVKLAGDLNTIWIRGGNDATAAQHLTMGDGLRLLLDTGNAMNRTAEKHLLALLRNTTPILLRAGNADHHLDGRRFWKDMEASAKTAVASLPRLLGAMGLLLLKLGQKKEFYMSSACFAVGQFMALADLLHREYCRNVRKGDIPNQLIGNAMMPIALENPERAVKRLNDRMMVYQRWAYTSDGDVKENRLGKWALKRLGMVSTELAGNPMPTQADDAGKAQMLLGYLARQESEAVTN